MPSFDILGNSPDRWAYALAVTVGIVAFVWLLRWLIVRRLGAIAARTSTSFDDSLVAVVRRTRLWLIWLPAALLASRLLSLPERADVVLDMRRRSP